MTSTATSRGVGLVLTSADSFLASQKITLRATPPAPTQTGGKDKESRTCNFNLILANATATNKIPITVTLLPEGPKPPTAVVYGEAEICEGQSAEIHATLGGTGPWTVIWSDDDVARKYESSPANRIVSPAAGKHDYSIKKLFGLTNNPSLPNGIRGSATVTVYQRLTVKASVPDGSTTATIVEGHSVKLSATASDGKPEYHYSWYPATGLDNPNSPEPNASPDQSTTYTVTVTDSIGSKPESAQLKVNVKELPHPTAEVVGPAEPVCPGAPATITVKLTGESPWSLHWRDGLSEPAVTDNPHTRKIESVQAETNYYLLSLSDQTTKTGRPNAKWSTTIKVYKPLTATIQGVGEVQQVQKGQSATIYANLSGGDGKNWMVKWSDGKTETATSPLSPHTVTPTEAQKEFHIVSLTDSHGCSASPVDFAGSIQFTINDLDAIRRDLDSQFIGLAETLHVAPKNLKTKTIKAGMGPLKDKFPKDPDAYMPQINALKKEYKQYNFPDNADIQHDFKLLDYAIQER